MNELEFDKWVRESAHERWRINQQMPAGQVLRSHEFGKAIFDIACDKKYKNYLEIGTWCGRGTTKCLLDGIIPRDDEACLAALETNLTFYEITKNYWAKYFQYKKINPEKLDLIWGSVITYDQLDDNYVTDNGETKETYSCNIDLKNAPLVKFKDDIDVLCLDGGHFSTFLEWRMFKDQIKVIILDDIYTSKSKEIGRELEAASDSWSIPYRTSRTGGRPGSAGELIGIKK